MFEQREVGSSQCTVRHLVRSAFALCALTAAGSLALAGVSGCGGGDEEVKYPDQQQQNYAQPQPTATQTAAPAPAETAPPPPATPQPLDAVTQAALAAAITARAPTEAKGLKPVGEVFGMTVPAGGQAESPQFMVDLNKCYGVIAEGGLGLTEVDIQIVPAIQIPGLQAATVAVDNTTGPKAAINPCFKNTYPIGFPAKVLLKATGGSGPIAAQIFMK